MSRSAARAKGLLSLAIAPVLAGSLTSLTHAAQVGFQSLANVHRVPIPNSTITAFPLNSPPINGFVPQVVIQLTDENDPNDELYSARVGTHTAGTSTVSGWGSIFKVATFDTGAQSNIISYADSPSFNFSGHNLLTPYSSELAGANGSEFADVTQPLGVYMTGLANATGGATLSATGTMRGQYNAAILSASDPNSVLPNIIGAPVLSQYQIAIRNSQPQTVTVGAKTYRSPNLTFTPLTSAPALPSNYSRLTFDVMSPNGVSPVASFIPTVNLNTFELEPSTPTFWMSLFADVDLADTGHTTNDRQFLFDTGAQVTVLSQDTAAEVGIYSAGENPSTPDFFVAVEGVGGTQQVPGFYLDSLNVMTNGGPITWSNVPVLVLDVIDPRDGVGYAPGVLGMNLFTDRDLILNGGLSNPSVAISPQMQWANNSSGNWSDTAKWILNTAPNNPDMPANFLGKITAPQSVTVNGSYTVGSLNFDNANRYTINGPGTLTLQSIEGTAGIVVAGGSHTLNAPMVFASDTVISVIPANSILTVNSTVTSTAVNITKNGAGKAEVKNIRATGLDVAAGTLQILANGGSAGTSAVATLSVTGTGKLDLRNNDLVVRTTPIGSWNGSSYTGVTGMIAAGRGTGTWNAPGLTTSETNATSGSGYTSLGVAKASEVLGIGASATGNWSGQLVTGSNTLVMYTYGGDANLTGNVDIDDYGQIDFNASTGGVLKGWYNGDFDYNGIQDIDDYGIIDFVIGIQGPNLSSADGANLTSVPEPSAACGLAFLATTFVCRRRFRAVSKVPGPMNLTWHATCR